MRAYIIRMPWNHKSCALSTVGYESGINYDYQIEYFNALEPKHVEEYFVKNNMKEVFDQSVPYFDTHKNWIKLRGMRGSVCSHILLWQKCVEINEPIVILEHDAVLIRKWPDVDWEDVLHLDYEGSIKRRHLRRDSDIYRSKIIDGVFEMGFSPADMPEMVTMNCVYAYAIKPSAAQAAISDVYSSGFFAADRILRSPIVKIETINPKIAEEQPDAMNISTTSE